jgi:hypothetical protein
MKEEPEIINAEINRVVLRLANQCPTRYYLDAKEDGSFSHVAIEIWMHDWEAFPDRLDVELKRKGFHHVISKSEFGFPYVIRRWEGRRPVYLGAETNPTPE